MRLFDLTEVTAQTFYHGSCDELPIGTVLKGRGDDYDKDWGSTDFYTVLEKYRPNNMLAHKDAVFMVADEDDIDLAGGCTDWLFHVTPHGRVTRHDINWSSEISTIVSNGGNLAELEFAASNYWNGVPHHDESVWEYICSAATITHVEEY